MAAAIAEVRADHPAELGKGSRFHLTIPVKQIERRESDPGRPVLSLLPHRAA